MNAVEFFKDLEQVFLKHGVIKIETADKKNYISIIDGDVQMNGISIICRAHRRTTEERCVCCGVVIPEGRQVCLKCENEWKEIKNLFNKK